MQKVKLYGVPRSGGTLVYNIVREVLPDYSIKPQKHSFFKDSEKAIVIFRDFRDSVISSWRVEQGEFDESENKVEAKYRWLISSIIGIKRQVFENLNRFRGEWKKDYCLFLRYENFFDDYEYIYSRLEKFLNIDISKDQQKILNTKYSRSQVKKRVRKFDDFSEYDIDHFHGLHIYSGIPGTWEELLQAKDHEKLTYSLYQELCEWGYEDHGVKQFQSNLAFDFEYKIFSATSKFRSQIKGITKGIREYL